MYLRKAFNCDGGIYMTLLRNWRKVMLLAADAVMINISYILAINLMFTYKILEKELVNYGLIAAMVTFIYLICFYLFKLYESLWVYAGIDEFMLSAGGCITGSVLSVLFTSFIGSELSHRVCIIAGMLVLLMVTGLRLSFRIWRRLKVQHRAIKASNMKRVLIIGAGDAGAMVVNEMKRHSYVRYIPVGFIDDDKRKAGTTISGVKVLGGRNIIKIAAEDEKVDEIIIAMPSLKGDSKRELIKLCQETECKIKVLPGVYELINGEVTLQQLREVDVEDLLGREPVVLDNEGISHYIKNKTVLVTGGGGSIGSELCRQISLFKPKKLLILDCYENNAYDLCNELKLNDKDLNVRVIIATVTDRSGLQRIFEKFSPEIVFHAAAHKHVPLMEDNPSEAVKNNIFGTLNAAQCADKSGVRRFVMVSTDKAVNPTNVMGATKRVCEMIIQAIDKQSSTEFVAVRFGNVLGSNGSVIPLFKKQIAKGGPVTVTHKAVTRYFMTITEAAQLVLQAGAYAEGGEVFVLDMGKPMRIYDLACDLIRLSGFEPHRDINIEVTGLRPGEKLYEELLTDEEGLTATKHDKIFIARPKISGLEMLKKSLDELARISEEGSKIDIIRKLQELVPTYRSQ
jgi:FlaA1/EpsC-like NDP-sugar epimerase